MNTVEIILAVLVLALIIIVFVQQGIIDKLKFRLSDISLRLVKIENSRNLHPIHRAHPNPIPHNNENA